MSIRVNVKCEKAADGTYVLTEDLPTPTVVITVGTEIMGLFTVGQKLYIDFTPKA